MEPWVRRHQPKKISSLIGQKDAVDKLVSFITKHKPGRAAFLFGPTGTGKTSAVYAAAEQFGFEVVEVNASDVRNKDSILQVIGGAIHQRSLFFRGKIILVDEVDGLAGREDMGGVGALVSLIEESSFPLILTANDPSDKKLAPLRKKAQLIEFPQLSCQDTITILSGIAKKEGVAYDEADMKALARRSGGDVRAAINDLQSLSGSGTLVDAEFLGMRNRHEPIEEALMRVLKTTDATTARESLFNLDEDPETILLWLDENMPREYTRPADLARAYDALSRADVFRGRIRRRQHWHFLVTVNAMLSLGVAASKDQKYKAPVSYEEPKRILKIWIANQKKAMRKAIAEKIAVKTHVSLKRVMQDYIPYIRLMAKASPGMAGYLELESEEEGWLG